MDKRSTNARCEQSRTRRHRIAIRMNDEEYERLCRKVNPVITAAKSRQAILIDLLLEGKVITPTHEQLEVEIEMAEAIRSLGNELAAEGRNLNQLSRRINSTKLNAISAGMIRREITELTMKIEGVQDALNEIRKSSI